MTPEVALATVDRLVLSPSAAELNVLGRIVHSREFEHTTFKPLVPKPVPDEEVPWPWSTDWASGTALVWRRAAMQYPPGSPWREEVLRRMATFNHDLDPRSARLYG